MAKAPSEWNLDPVAVRRRAKSIGGCQPVATNNDNILSFLVGLGGDLEGLARVNIYVDSGTIGTCRVVHGPRMCREIFRRNVTSLDVVERLLRCPPQITAIDDTLVGLQDPPNIADVSTSSRQQQQHSLKSDMELAEVGLCILHGEKEKLESHLEPLEHSSKDASENDDDESEEGMEFQFSLPAAAMKHVEQCLKDISRMGKLVKGVATNGKGTIFLYGNGGVAYTPNIPKALYHKLKQLRNSHISSRPSYVSLGTRDRYFVAFKDDTFDWKGPKQLDRILKGLKEAPRSVAFGNSYDTFFVVFHDGSWKYHGRTIPQALANKLEQRNDKPDLVCVNLGPQGEWFLRCKNGRMWWGNVSAELDDVTQEILQAGSFLHFIDFGEDGSYFLSHDS